MLAILAFDAAGHATGAGVVGHEDQKTTREADEGRKGSAFVAAFLFLDLNQDFLALIEQFTDVAVARLATVLEIFFRDFLQRQEAMALGAVVDEARFETRLDARDATFIDVGFFLFLGGYFDIEVVDSLSINQCNSQLFFLSCVDEHSLHEALLSIQGPRNHA